MVSFSCSQCQKALKVKDELAEKRIRCPHCQHVQGVPGASPSVTIASTASIHGQAHARAADDVTLPPSTRSASAADDVMLGPALRQTETYPAIGREARDSEREVIKAGIAYEVEGEIARGGMGAIMRAVDQDIRREVAVKFLLDQADERQKTRFMEEAQITGQLEHPNIVPIHQLGVHEDGRCFFSMKMVKAWPLGSTRACPPRNSGSATTREFKK